jgi:HTH-type transcriptional regulator/antitoxin HigA
LAGAAQEAQDPCPATLPIKEQLDYERALRRVKGLWAWPKGSPESDELDGLVNLIEAYEKEHYRIDFPDPVEAIKFRLEQKGKDLSLSSV